MVHGFFDPNLLETEYLKRLKKARDHNSWPYRNDEVLLNSLESIYNCNQQDAKYFAKEIIRNHKQKSPDIKNCHAVFAEVIVYAYYMRLVIEGIVKSLDRKKDDYDLRIELADGSFHHLEIFSVMPNCKISELDDNGILKPENVIVNDVKTHLQEPLASIRQKLLSKIRKQKQLSEQRNNFAVIELNDVSIAGDFHILSSLSNGYKLKIDKETGMVVDRGFDWSNTIFEIEDTRYIKAIIWFSLGDYNNRKIIFNPNFNT